VDFLTRLFDTSDFPTRWHCGNWSVGHGWLHILADLGVWSAYVAIPCVLAFFVLRRRDIPFRKIFWLFGAFILACGTTHLMEALLFWWPAYRLAGVIKLLTALVSWGTVIALVPVVPQVLTMRSPEELEREVVARKRAEGALHRANAELELRVQQRTAELAQANAALSASEERLRLALEAGHMGTWEWNLRDNQVIWSPGLEAIHGLAPGSFAGTFEAYQHDLHPEDRAYVLGSITQAVEKGTEHHLEYRILWPDSGVHWIEARGKVYQDESGRPLRMMGVCTDIDERKHAEKTVRFLADASAALATLVDYGSTLQKVAALAVPFFADWCAVDMLEANGILRRLAVAHLDPAKVRLAHQLHERYPPDPAAPQGVWKILRTGQSEFISDIPDALLVETVKDEELLRILRELGLKSYIGVPLTVRGKTIGVVTFIAAESGRRYDDKDLAVAEDLAHRATVAIENARLYREVTEADRRKSEFLATLAHELRNPLAPLRNGLQVLRLASEPEVKEQTRQMMERQLGQLVRLVDDLLDISRISRNKLELRKAPISLTSVVENAVETARPVIDSRGHTLTVTLPPQPVYLDADLTRLAQVFWNLLHNSAKYTNPGGRIELSAQCLGSEVVVTVRDNGIGIPAEALPGLFTLFSQVDTSLDRSQGGLGIGLALVKGLVKMHGGTVEAQSPGAGKGSAFVVRLPVVPDAGQKRETPAADSKPGHVRRRVLVVDDNRDAAASLTMMLALVGHDTRTAHDGLEAVELAEAFRPEVILLDIGLPKLNGYDACRRIREQPWGRDLFIVAVTGWGQEEDRHHSRDAGFDQHLVKPVDFAKLEKLLAQLKSARNGR
jgi:PAS domain S-box-containing protein